MGSHRSLHHVLLAAWVKVQNWLGTGLGNGDAGKMSTATH